VVESHQRSGGPPGGTLAFSIYGRRDGAGRGEQLPARSARLVLSVGGDVSAGEDCFGRAGAI
jgi:hypothetical protein